MIKPYYDRKGITIYHADCRDILPQLEPVDLVLTDPPYGIGGKWKGGSGQMHGWASSHKIKDERNTWDSTKPNIETIRSVSLAGKIAIIWGGNYFDLPPSRGWFVWNKPERGFSLAEAELAWTNIDNVTRVFDHHRHNTVTNHPTEKPIKLMIWCIEKSNTKGLILDPFMGSGTTLVAAKQLGRKAIGIEIEEKYCEIAVERLKQEVFDFSQGR